MDVNDELHRKIVQLHLDAARYRWLRKQSPEVSDGLIDVVRWNACEGYSLRGGELDSFVDEAMKEMQ